MKFLDPDGLSDCGIYGKDGEYTEKTKRDQAAYEEQLKNGYSAPHENPSVSAYYGIPGFFPVVDDVGLSKSKGVNYTLSIFASTYNLLASFGNVMIGGASEAYSLIDAGFEYVFGLNLDEAANTLMANGMLAPAGIMLDSFNTYMEYMKLTTSSNMLKTGIDIGKTSVNIAASELGISGLGNKKVPNPNGKKGSITHQNKIKSINSIFNGEMQTEFKFDTPGGIKNNRYADKVEILNGRVIAIHQVGKVNKNGLPVLRESQAIQDIMSSPKYNGAPIYFWAYNNPEMGPIIYTP